MANGAFVGKIPFFIWILCHRFLEIERSKKVSWGGGGGRLATFSRKDDVINQKGSNKNIEILILNKIIN